MFKMADVQFGKMTTDLFADTAAILISIVSNSYYGMPRGQIHINLPPEHPIMSFETIEIKMAAVSAKRSMGFGLFASLSKGKIHLFSHFTTNLSYFSSLKLPYKIQLLAFRSALSSDLLFKQG